MVNQLDDTSIKTFATGRPMEDSPNLRQCKHCKKGITDAAAKKHIAECLRVKKEKAQRKKEAREAREKAKEAAREEEARRAGEEDKADDDDSDDEGDKKNIPNGTAKKATASVIAATPTKKVELDDKKGKKRKAESEAEKPPKPKKKKEEPKPKVAKPKGLQALLCGLCLSRD